MLGSWKKVIVGLSLLCLHINCVLLVNKVTQTISTTDIIIVSFCSSMNRLLSNFDLSLQPGPKIYNRV